MLKKRFLKHKIEIFKLSKIEITIGVVLGLGYASTLYFFLKLIREFFRVYSAYVNDYNLIILSEKATNFYNFFFAFIAVLFGQSVIIVYWFNRPKKYFSKYHYKKISLVNDHRLTNWYFLHWFVKIGVIIGLIALESYIFDIYPNYHYLFILIAIVLFLQVWSNFRLFLKNESFKWIISSLIIILIVSFGLSKINLIDYKKLDENLLNNNIYYKYNINPPTSSVYESARLKSLLVNLFYIENSNDTTPKLIINSSKINLNNLQNTIHNIQEKVRQDNIEHINYRLHIDRNIKMINVTNLKNELINLGAVRISYAIRPFKTKLPSYFKFELSFPMHKILADSKENSDKNQIEIKFLNNKNYLFNNAIITEKELKFRLKESIKSKPSYFLKIYINDHISFNDYFKVISTLVESLNELKDAYSEKEFNMNYKQLTQEYFFNQIGLLEYEKVKYKYTINIIDRIEIN